MQYMLLIYGDENAWEGMSAEEQAEGLKPWQDYAVAEGLRDVRRRGRPRPDDGRDHRPDP